VEVVKRLELMDSSGFAATLPNTETMELAPKFLYYFNTTGFHSVDTNSICLESVDEFEKRTDRKISNFENNHGISYKLNTGNQNIYYRRSGPKVATLNDYQVRIRKEPNLDGEHVA
jgi:hypothetical protein